MIKIAINGYGNLAKGAEAAILRTPDMELVAVFTRRDPKILHPLCKETKVLPFSEIEKYKNECDVLLNCGGSATDLPVTTPFLAEHFHVVDSFDTHASIPAHFEKTNKAAKKGGKLALISAGWDPGMFSLARLYGNAILPDGKDYTFWGRGVSQGHSDAIRRIEGVEDARQYTVPVEAALQAVQNGETPELTAGQKHTRECFVVAKPGTDKARIEREIKTMPHYFADYDTTVTFVTAEELQKNHSGMPHGGSVIRSGETGINEKHRHIISYNLTLDSNPEFTGSVLCACARAVYRLAAKGETGCRTLFDIPPALFSPLSAEDLRKKYL